MNKTDPYENYLSADEAALFHSGTNTTLYRKLGVHRQQQYGVDGCTAAVWAPHARSAALICDRCDWEQHPVYLQCDTDGIWSGFVPQLQTGDHYRFVIVGADGKKRYKSDPLAFFSELRPANASIVYPYDGAEKLPSTPRKAPDVYGQPMAVYELHPGSWKKDFHADVEGFLNYRRLADQLAEYVSYMGFTHVELIGICEHPLDCSWGYQVTGYFSPTSRCGRPDDLRYLIDTLHRNNIGVILDWVPAHFPKDDYGLAAFDGTALYESADPLLAEYPEWGTKAFDLSRPEVCSFLLSSACYWVREFGFDALRVDAVAALLYTSFGRQQWRTNEDGSSENRHGIAFLRRLNDILQQETTAYLIAEDSSVMAGITAPTDAGGLGFRLKWSLGWMNDTLRYLGRDPLFRRWHHGELIHLADYAFTEHFLLPLSHDEVVHLKKTLLEKMPGSRNDRFGCLKALYAFQFTFPGKKLLFMGQELAAEREWDEKREPDWYLADQPEHRDVMQTLRKLLWLYRHYPCLHRDTLDPRCFCWIKSDDADRNIICFVRRCDDTAGVTEPYSGELLIIINFSPVAYPEYRCGAPLAGNYRRLFSSYDCINAGYDVDPRPTSDAPMTATEHLCCDGCENALHYHLRPYEAAIFGFSG